MDGLENVDSVFPRHHLLCGSHLVGPKLESGFLKIDLFIYLRESVRTASSSVGSLSTCSQRPQHRAEGLTWSQGLAAGLPCGWREPKYLNPPLGVHYPHTGSWAQEPESGLKLRLTSWLLGLAPIQELNSVFYFGLMEVATGD